MSSDFSDHALYVMNAEKILVKDAAYIRRAESKFKALSDSFQELLGDNGIFLHLPSPRLPSYHHQTLFNPINFIYTAIINVLGLPSTQCPLGLSTKGVPLGIQVVGNRFQDHVTLAVARELEKAFGGWVAPCPIP